MSACQRQLLQDGATATERLTVQCPHCQQGIVLCIGEILLHQCIRTWICHTYPPNHLHSCTMMNRQSHQMSFSSMRHSCLSSGFTRSLSSCQAFSTTQAVQQLQMQLHSNANMKLCHWLYMVVLGLPPKGLSCQTIARQVSSEASRKFQTQMLLMPVPLAQC